MAPGDAKHRPVRSGEGFLLLGVLARGETTSPALPRKRERESTAGAAAT